MLYFMSTSKGGGRVTYITNQVASNFVKTIKKKNKEIDVKSNRIKNHGCVFVNCLVENPAQRLQQSFQILWILF